MTTPSDQALRARLTRLLRDQARRASPALAEAASTWYLQRPIFDVFGSGRRSGRTACLSYIPAAFRRDPRSAAYLNHSNLWECTEMARALGELGYSVDVHFFQSAASTRREHTVFVDLGLQIEQYRAAHREASKVIGYATGRHWVVQNAAEYARLEALRRRRGVALAPRRQTPTHGGFEQADAIVAIGNDVMRESYSHARASYHQVPLSLAAELIAPQSRGWDAVRRTFLWLGSGGLVHKGLDLVLEAFAANPDLTLHVVGPVDREVDFATAYAKELRGTPNIHTHGFLGLTDPRFRAVAASCGGLIYPSCSEGTGGAILAAMATGLPPIVSRECSFDPGPAGVVLEESSIDAIVRAVEAHAAQAPGELRERSEASVAWVAARHSRERFGEAIREALGRVLRGGAA